MDDEMWRELEEALYYLAHAGAIGILQDLFDMTEDALACEQAAALLLAGSTEGSEE
jgi:hypothetical protein